MKQVAHYLETFQWYFLSDELINTSYDHFDITCPRGPGNDKHKFTNCFSTSKTSGNCSFYIWKKYSTYLKYFTCRKK